jgi:hypothetical protein
MRSQETDNVSYWFVKWVDSAIIIGDLEWL